MKCQRCPKQVTYHITEVLGEGQVEDLHFCEECSKKYLFHTPMKKGKPVGASISDADAGETSLHGQLQCPECGIKFVEFRNGGRLGCPHDYEAFREDLVPLLESVHGEPKHAGKIPRHRPTFLRRVSQTRPPATKNLQESLQHPFGLGAAQFQKLRG